MIWICYSPRTVLRASRGSLRLLPPISIPNLSYYPKPKFPHLGPTTPGHHASPPPLRPVSYKKILKFFLHSRLTWNAAIIRRRGDAGSSTPPSRSPRPNWGTSGWTLRPVSRKFNLKWLKGRKDTRRRVGRLSWPSTTQTATSHWRHRPTSRRSRAGKTVPPQVDFLLW